MFTCSCCDELELPTMGKVKKGKSARNKEVRSEKLTHNNNKNMFINLYFVYALALQQVCCYYIFS